MSDEDADNIDYDELLAQMKESTAEGSKERVKQGYQSIELIGWASPPFYDKGISQAVLGQRAQVQQPVCEHVEPTIFVSWAGRAC